MRHLKKNGDTLKDELSHPAGWAVVLPHLYVFVVEEAAEMGGDVASSLDREFEDGFSSDL